MCWFLFIYLFCLPEFKVVFNLQFSQESTHVINISDFVLLVLKESEKQQVTLPVVLQGIWSQMKVMQWWKNNSGQNPEEVGSEEFIFFFFVSLLHHRFISLPVLHNCSSRSLHKLENWPARQSAYDKSNRPTINSLWIVTSCAVAAVYRS